MSTVYGIIYEQGNCHAIVSFDGVELFGDINEAKRNFIKHLDLEFETYEIDICDDYNLTEYFIEYNELDGLSQIDVYSSNQYQGHVFTLYIKQFVLKV